MEVQGQKEFLVMQAPVGIQAGQVLMACQASKEQKVPPVQLEDLDQW